MFYVQFWLSKNNNKKKKKKKKLFSIDPSQRFIKNQEVKKTYIQISLVNFIHYDMGDASQTCFQLPQKGSWKDTKQ